MINNDRIVPVTTTDLLSLYGLILILTGVNVAALAALNVEGDFLVAANGTYLANQPVDSLDFADTVTAATVYFVPSFEYDGEGVEDADGHTLYKATLADAAVTIEKVGF